MRQHGERIEHVMRDHSLPLTYRRQVVRAIPFREEIEIRGELLARIRGAADIANASSCASPLSMSLVSLPSRTTARCSHAREATLQVHEQQRDRCRRNTEMRAAWPIVSGLCRLSLCWTSDESPRTVR
jgi:hypothetical protein